MLDHVVHDDLIVAITHLFLLKIVITNRELYRWKIIRARLIQQRKIPIAMKADPINQHIITHPVRPVPILFSHPFTMQPDQENALQAQPKLQAKTYVDDNHA